MKKTLLVVFLAVMALVFANGVSNATLTGVCSTCHTMHNSQDGTAMTYDVDGATLTTTPRGYLLIGSCAYCHIEVSTDKTTAVGGWNVASSTAGFPSGYFSATDTNAHVTQETTEAGITAGDTYYATLTPGSDFSTGVQGSDDLTCAGCHAASGSHHAVSSTVYRMIAGVTGLKADLSASDMESTVNHNVVEAAGMNTFCASCHDVFHGTANTGSASPFVRHPTGNAVTNDTTGVTVSYTNNPFGFSSVGSLSTATAYTSTNAQVMCISCHRAHGSGNPDNLRFSYSTQNAGTGTGTGCQGCHKK